VALLSLGLTRIGAQPTDELDTLLARLASGPFQTATLFELEGQRDDGRIMPALRQAFSRTAITGEKQWIASTLVRLGDNDRLYSNFLIEAAKPAVEDRSPIFFAYDQNGNSVRGQFSLAFELWCQAEGKNPMAVAALQLDTYPEMYSCSPDPKLRPHTTFSGKVCSHPTPSSWATQSRAWPDCGTKKPSRKSEKRRNVFSQTDRPSSG